MDWERIKVPVLETAKWLCLVLAVLFIVMISAGGRVSAAAFADVAGAVTEVADLSATQEGDNLMFKRLYGLDASDYEDILLYCPATNMGAEELLLVKLADTSQQEAVAAAMQARVDGQLNVFEGYGVDQCDMLSRSIIEVRGNYVLFVSAADPAAVRQAFLSAL